MTLNSFQNHPFNNLYAIVIRLNIGCFKIYINAINFSIAYPNGEKLSFLNHVSPRYENLRQVYYPVFYGDVLPPQLLRLDKKGSGEINQKNPSPNSRGFYVGIVSFFVIITGIESILPSS